MALSDALEPLPYHHAVVDDLKTEERARWDWFASAQAREDYTASLRLALLKSTYRLDADAHPDLYWTAEQPGSRRPGAALPARRPRRHVEPLRR